MTIVTTASAPPKCDASTTKIGITEWGMRGIVCQVRTGLRSFTDRSGQTRWYCGSQGHQQNVERRFGREMPMCYRCARLIPPGSPMDEMAVTVSIGGAIRLKCSYCQDKDVVVETHDGWELSAELAE